MDDKGQEIKRVKEGADTEEGAAMDVRLFCTSITLYTRINNEFSVAIASNNYAV